MCNSKTLNGMCKSCTNLGTTCEGSYNPIWSGCIYKKVGKMCGKFTKFFEDCNRLVIACHLSDDDISYDDVVYVARFYDVKDNPRFGYHMITHEGAEKLNSKLPVGNYSSFIEFFK